MRYVVGYLNFYDNKLLVKSVDAAGCWKMALILSGYIDKVVADTISNDFEQAKADAFDQDWTFDVKEIPNT